MAFEISEVKEAYIKLKSYIYYDNTDLLLRRKLVEFESGRTQGFDFIFKQVPYPYTFEFERKDDLESYIHVKLEQFTDNLNRYHLNQDFFKYFLEQIDVTAYPKKYREEIANHNFLTNNRTKNGYEVKRVTAFIDAPIEIHLICTLWTIKYGVLLDQKLDGSCFGNRLLLDYNKKSVVKGSGLFKPYYKQYQTWRDQSIETAKELLKNEKNVLFLNLDIKDYFHSVRIEKDYIFSSARITESNNEAINNLLNIFQQVHLVYSKLVSSLHKIPSEFIDELDVNSDGELEYFILPIGLLSSYILANDYLNKFDKRITQRIKPAYYGRYVDDILLVLSDPNPFDSDETESEFRFNFEEYKSKIENKNQKHSKVSFQEDNLNDLETYILRNFEPIIYLVDSPFTQDSSKEEGRVFKLNSYDSLFCQSEKTLLFYFEKDESDLVIDKLKRELDEKASEFKDMPDSDDDDSFEKNAYHLNYDGTDGKIRTLKDYSENRYGLTIYLSNKIFSALRQDKKISDDEKRQVRKFFKGLNCLTFYRLWEKIFTFYLVNDEPDLYIDFYVHCVEQIEKIGNYISLQDRSIRESLFDHLDASHELVITLNPNFIKKTQKSERNFEFKLNAINPNNFTLFTKSVEPTKNNSHWFMRYRETNMLRHQYIIHPLLSYTKLAKENTDLTSIHIDFEKYVIDNGLLKNSPRRIKFWECCMSIAFEMFGNVRKIGGDSNYIDSNLLGIEKFVHESDESKNFFKFYLDDAYERFCIANENHIPEYDLKDPKLKAQFYILQHDEIKFDKIKPVILQEITVNKNDKLFEPRIAFANTHVNEDNIVKNLKKQTNFSPQRYHKFKNILKIARREAADILLFPEFFIPINLLSSLIRYSEKNQCLTITGLEHIILRDVAFNFIVSIQPVVVNGVKDATVIFRLKNHYAPTEEHLIDGLHLSIPKPQPYRYDIINWRNIYFSNYYCFELADALHRSIFKGKIDLLVGIEWNKDTSYFSNIVEACTRDLHVYFAQVNTSHYGDTRLTQPVDSARKDILRLKGGVNDTVLVATINTFKLRDFQRKRFSLTHQEKEYKPLPPDFRLIDVLTRIKNDHVL